MGLAEAGERRARRFGRVAGVREREPEKEEVLPRGRHSTIILPPNASMQRQPDGLTIRTKSGP